MYDYNRSVRIASGSWPRIRIVLGTAVFIAISIVLLGGCVTQRDQQGATETTTYSTRTSFPQSRTPTIIPDPILDLPPGQYFVYWENDNAWIGSLNEMAIDRWPFNGYLSPDGNRLTFSENQKIFIHDLLSGEIQEIQIEDFRILEMSDPTWSPDAGYLAFAATTLRIEGGEGIADEFPSIYVYSIEDGRTVQLTHWQTYEAFPSWSPDGRYLAFASDVHQISAYENAGTNQTDIFLLPTECISNPTSCDQNIVQITDMGPSASATMPSWSADSESIAFRCSFLPVQEDEEITDYQTDICTVNLDGTNLMNITNTPETNETRPVYSYVGSLLAYTGQSFQEDQYGYDDDMYIVSMPDRELILQYNSADIQEEFQFWLLFE